MPGPATVEELLQLVERSQVADRPVVQKAYSAWQEKSGSSDEPPKFAQFLIESGVITSFHAEQLLAGRYKGFRVGAYRILRLIGVGGMGRVYLAEHAFMKRRVALKILPKSQNKEGSAIERFQREAQAVAALNHPNIVHAYDSGQEGDVYFLAMEYVAGESVQDYVKLYGRVPWPYAADFIRQAAEGLQHAADSGLVHRDIKPGNLLVDLVGTVKLLDLGLAMFFTEQLEGDPLTLRYNENVLGTADYLAPEQAVDSHNIDIRADIYSLGGTLYYLLTGQAPFPAGTIAQKLLWHQQKDPEPVTRIVPDVPKALEVVLQKMMAKKPELRYPTAAAVAAALAPFSKPHPRPFPADAAQQYDAIAPRGSGRPAPSSTKPAHLPPGPSAGAPPLHRPTPGGNAAAMLERPSKPPSSIVKMPKGVDTKPRSTVKMTRPPTPDGGMDFLRGDSQAAQVTKRDLPTLETATAPMAPSKPAINIAWVWAGTAVAAVGILGSLVYYSISKETREAAAGSTVIVVKPGSGPKKPEHASANGNIGDIYVRTGLGVTGPQSLADALETAVRGSRVVLSVKASGDWDVNPMIIGPGGFAKCENLHVVGEKPTVALSTSANEQPIILVRRTRGFTIKDLTIDGNGRTDPLVVLEGDGVENCRLENVTFQNFAGDAVQLRSVRGQKNAAVSITNCTFRGTPTSRGIVLTGAPDDPSPSKEVTIDSCRFLECKAGVAVRGPLATAEVTRSIFANGTAGVVFAPGAAVSLLTSFRVDHGTFWKLAEGVVLEDAPSGGGKVTVSDSLFIEVGAPPLSGPPTVAERLKAPSANLEVSGVFANQVVPPKDPAKATAVGAAPVAANVEFQETDPQKPDFLRPKGLVPGAREPGKPPAGAVLP